MTEKWKQALDDGLCVGAVDLLQIILELFKQKYQCSGQCKKIIGLKTGKKADLGALF